MNPIARSATEAALFAFAFSAVAGLVLYPLVFGVHVSDAVSAAVALGLVAFASAFILVWSVVRNRLSRKRPALGATRGAAVGVLVVVTVASAHAAFTYGSGGFLYGLFGQVAFACLFGGAPAAIIGALVGRSIERRILASSGS